MKAALLSELTAPHTSEFPRLLRSSGDSRFTQPDTESIANVALRPKLEILSQSPNKLLALEAESVFNELLAKMDKDGHEITDPKVIKFAKKALENNEYSFQERLPGDVEVIFSGQGLKNFSFYETRTQTAKAIASRNSGRPLEERLLEQDTEHRVQTGMLTIQKFNDKDIRISVFETQKGHMKGFRLAV